MLVLLCHAFSLQSRQQSASEGQDEHEGENGLAASEDSSGARGDLSRAERQMLRNLLHFSEHDADDVAVPRGEIIAVDAAISWEQMVAAFSESKGRPTMTAEISAL